MNDYAPLQTFDLTDLFVLYSEDNTKCGDFVLEVAQKYLRPNEFIYLQQACANVTGCTVAHVLGVSEAYVSKQRRAVYNLTRCYVWFALHEERIVHVLAAIGVSKLRQDLVLLLIRQRPSQTDLAHQLHVSQQGISHHFKQTMTQLHQSNQAVAHDLADFLCLVRHGKKPEMTA